MKFTIFCSLLFLWSCAQKREHIPSEFVYINKYYQHEYTKDSLSFVLEIKQWIENKKDPFYPEIFTKESQVMIDTILYSPDKSKVVFFVITKNDNHTLLRTNNPNGFHFDARCFFGLRSNSHDSWNIYRFRYFNVILFDSYEASSTRLREMHFQELASVKDSQGKSQFKYNLNDVRFWSGPAWEFTKINQPEIYERK
ncbi:MAG TPA: hypothetical protein PLZ12_18240 [Saprospiraceae bacterium]|nr:hypothetical protein [Saprospiraceae bacterium]